MDIKETKVSSIKKLNASIPNNISVSTNKSTVTLTRNTISASSELKFDKNIVVITNTIPLIGKIYKS
jgi:hypothetical protein